MCVCVVHTCSVAMLVCVHVHCRFELPYNIWCDGCGAHVGMGVRYNAEKSRIGSYYTTPIFKFRMKCHLCDNYFEIHTDPKVCAVCLPVLSVDLCVWIDLSLEL